MHEEAPVQSSIDVAAPINVAALIDGQKIGTLLIAIIFLGFFAQIGEGYDLAAAAYAAPGIARAWHVHRELLGPVFSASLFGMLFGAPIFGWLGDRYGRRFAIILSTVVCGVFTLASAGTTSLWALGLLRFLTGIGLGGLPANTIAIMAEYAPKRSRALLITLMFMGITFGGTVPALVTVISPGSGWQLLFVVGGIMPLAAAMANFLYMPESLKFLAVRDAAHIKMLRIVRAMRPDLPLPDDAQFVFPHRSGRSFRIGQLFEGKLRLMTPLIWALFATNLMANFFLNSWMPTLFRDSGLSASQTALTNSMYYVGGIVGGLTISRSLDKANLGIVALFMLLSCPAVLWLGHVDYSPSTLKIAVLFVGITVLGNQLALNSVAGLTYPTVIRANGTGWALGVGRFGAILGPLIGGQLISMHLSLQYLFMAPMVPLFIGAIAAFFLRPMVRERWSGNFDAVKLGR